MKFVFVFCRNLPIARRTLSLNTEKDDATSGRLPSVLHAERRAPSRAADHGLSAAAGKAARRARQQKIVLDGWLEERKETAGRIGQDH